MKSERELGEDDAIEGETAEEYAGEPTPHPKTEEEELKEATVKIDEASTKSAIPKQEEDESEREKKERMQHLPDSMRAKASTEIDILLVRKEKNAQIKLVFYERCFLQTETDTIWMLELLGTCKEIDPDKKGANEDGDGAGEGARVGDSEAHVSGYELVESWTQTLDFSKKKKGAQCDDIVTDECSTQVSLHCTVRMVQRL